MTTSATTTPAAALTPEQAAAAAISKVDATPGVQINGEPANPQAGDRPSWLPEKFQSPEALAQAYAELERKLGGAKQEPPATQETPTAEPKADDKATEGATEEKPELTPEASKVAEALSEKGVSFDDLTTEFATAGELSADSYAKLEKAGFPKQVVDTWIAGQQAMIELDRQQTFSLTGGEDGFNAMVQWAAANLKPAEVAAYNATIDSGDKAKTRLAVEGLYARYTAAKGVEPTLTAGSTSGSAGVAPFRSTAELTAAMRDPRYASDPAYRKDVENRLAISDVF